MKGLLASAKLSYDFSEKAEFIAASTAYLDGIKPVRENGRLVCATVLQHTLKICQDRLGTDRRTIGSRIIESEEREKGKGKTKRKRKETGFESHRPLLRRRMV